MERIVQFGPAGRLVGVLSGGSMAADAPTLVLPSAGLLPRYGPFRLHVELARRLAPHGIRTFRFEVPGVGETPRLTGYGAREATAAALDHLAAEYDCRRFVVGGLCSGADTGWRAAIDDDRVIGMLMLDGISFTGPWFHFARLGNIVKRGPRHWARVAARLAGGLGKGATPTVQVGDYREWPGRVQARQQFADLVARNTRSLWIYTGGYRDTFLHRRQFSWSFGAPALDPCITLRYWPDCDHTFYARTHRDRLLDTVETWLLDLDNVAGTAQ